MIDWRQHKRLFVIVETPKKVVAVAIAVEQSYVEDPDLMYLVRREFAHRSVLFDVFTVHVALQRCDFWAVPAFSVEGLVMSDLDTHRGRYTVKSLRVKQLRGNLAHILRRRCDARGLKC